MADEVPLIFTPDNEAYLGLPSVHELDLLISSSAVLSQKVGVSSRMTDLNDSRLLYLKSRHLFSRCADNYARSRDSSLTEDA